MLQSIRKMRVRKVKQECRFKEKTDELLCLTLAHLHSCCTASVDVLMCVSVTATSDISSVKARCQLASV